MTVLVTQELGKDYGKLTAVAALNLEIPAGEIFGLLGPNGAGKTTAISMICGVVTPSRGTAFVAGNDIRTSSSAARGLIGLVPQDLAVYEDLTARQNLSFFGRLYGLRGSDLSTAMDWSLGVAGLTDRAHESVKRFSGGMKRRLNLAVGLLHRPKLLILDEPTVGVDPQSRVHVFDTIRELNSDHGMTVIYTSHYMEEVEELCSRIGIVDHGKLVALDSLRELLRSHGHGGLEITFAGSEEIVARVLPHGEIDGDRVRIPDTGPVGPLVSELESSGLRVTGVQVHQMDLETVFLNLTGRTLRDAS